MKLFSTICVAALVLALAVPAFAETQNVKISGDIAVAHIYQKNLDLDKDDNDGATAGTSDSDNLITQIVGVNIAADLTDNVSTYVRVVNQRDWNDVNAEADIILDEAYVTMKEMLYAPLTVKIGRQNMWFGKGMIIGNNFRTWDEGGTIRNDELSATTAFDAIRATLDYDPWTVDLAYAVIDENTVNTNDDISLVGVNVGYIFDKYDAEAEAYVWHQSDQSAKPTADTDDLTTLGIRGSFVPYENMDVWAEGAHQTGTYHDTATGTFRTDKDRDAWMVDVGINYEFADVKWTPDLGLEYIYMSGDDTNQTGTGDYEGWNSMYQGKFDSLIRAYMDQVAVAYAQTDAYAAARQGQTGGTTNQNQLKIHTNLDLMEDLTLDADLSLFWFDEGPFISGGDDEIGQELDGYLTYDYTEDVQFKVAAGVFWPDDAYEGNNSADDIATKVISAVTVGF